MMLLLLSIALIAGVMAVMAVGVIFKNRCLRGSCGGAEVFDADGEPLNCSTCPKRKNRGLRPRLPQPKTGLP